MLRVVKYENPGRLLCNVVLPSAFLCMWKENYRCLYLLGARHTRSCSSCVKYRRYSVLLKKMFQYPPSDFDVRGNFSSLRRPSNRFPKRRDRPARFSIGYRRFVQTVHTVRVGMFIPVLRVALSQDGGPTAAQLPQTYVVVVLLGGEEHEAQPSPVLIGLGRARYLVDNYCTVSYSYAWIDCTVRSSGICVEPNQKARDSRFEWNYRWSVG
jgi:hypothetical protein